MSTFREKCVTDRETEGWINEGTHRQIIRAKLIEPVREGEFKIQMFVKDQNILRRCPRLNKKILKSVKNLF